MDHSLPLAPSAMAPPPAREPKLSNSDFRKARVGVAFLAQAL